MTLVEFASVYCNRVGGSPGYLEQLVVLCRRLPWRPEDLSPDRIDAYLTEALKKLAPSTVDNHRRMLRSLLKFAASERLVDASIVRPLRRVKVPEPNPIAWSHEQIRGLLAVAAQMPGRTRHCPLHVLMPAWILAAYSTGLRLNDLLAIRHDAIRGQRILIPQMKTTHPHVVYLDNNAMQAIALLPRKGPRVFGDLVGRSRIIVAMRLLVKRAEAAGSTKYLRRSGATYAEINGKDATRHLGHKDPKMKARYIDKLLFAEETKQEQLVPPIELAAHNP